MGQWHGHSASAYNAHMPGSIRYLFPALVLSLAGLACPASRPMQVPPSAAPVVSDIPAGEGQASEPGTVDVSTPNAGGRPDGGACFSSANCLSNTCEGASCDSSRPGTCVPQERACTTDLVEFCGCDGKTFLSSSSCPGEAFSVRGACPNERFDDSPDESLGDESSSAATP